MLYKFKLKNILLKRTYRRVILPALGIFCLFCLSSPGKAQGLNHERILNLPYLSYSNELPKGLLSERSAILIDDNIPSGKRDKGLPPWKSFATKAHETFSMLGIDPVAYYNLDLVLAGRSVTRSFADDIKNRAIPLAILLKRELTPSNDTVFTLILARLSKEDIFFTSGQSAYKIQSNSLGQLMQQFTRDVSVSGLEKGNFLILEVPEFFEETEIFTARRFESFNPDLKLDKLAVPLFEERLAPMSLPPGMQREEVTAQVNVENQQIKDANERLEAIMRGYPFSSGPVAYSEGEAVWRNEGYLFVLLNIHGKVETVRKLLNYETIEDQPTYTSTKMVDGKPITQEIPKGQEVYKFYVKHLPTGEVYLGNYWDAATTWEQALQNYIANLKAALKVE